MEEDNGIMKVSQIMRQCHRGIDRIIQKEKILKKRKYEECLKFV